MEFYSHIIRDQLTFQTLKGLCRRKWNSRKKHKLTTANHDLSSPSQSNTRQLRAWIFSLHPKSGIWKRTCACQINWITARDDSQSAGRWSTSKISSVPPRSTPGCCTHSWFLGHELSAHGACSHKHTPCSHAQKIKPEQILLLCSRDHGWRWQRQRDLVQRLHWEEKLSNSHLKLWFLGIPKPAHRSALRPAHETLIVHFQILIQIRATLNASVRYYCHKSKHLVTYLEFF